MHQYKEFTSSLDTQTQIRWSRKLILQSVSVNSSVCWVATLVYCLVSRALQVLLFSIITLEHLLLHGKG